PIFKFEQFGDALTSARIVEIAQNLGRQGVGQYRDIDVQIGDTLIPGDAFEKLVDEATRYDFMKLDVDRNFNSSVKGKVINLTYTLERTAFWGGFATLAGAMMLIPDGGVWGQIQMKLMNLAAYGIMVSGSTSFAGSLIHMYTEDNDWSKKLLYFVPN